MTDDRPPYPWKRTLGTVICAILSLICCAALVFALRMSGIWLIPAFGLLGFTVVLQAFPWLLLLCSVIVLATFTSLLRQLPQWQSRPRWMLTPLPPLIVIVLGLVIGMGLSQTLRPPREPEHFPGNPLLRGYGTWRFHNVFRGTITDVRNTELGILTSDGKPATVRLEPGTQFPNGRAFKKNDRVLIIGEQEGTAIRAFGIRTVPQRGSR